MKLKPCPFCNPKQIEIEGFDSTAQYNPTDIIGLGSSYYWCKCENCGAMGPGRPTKDLAVSAWNTRPAEQELLEALKTVLGLATPFPTINILTSLANATELLLNRYDYDGHGHEVIHYNMVEARKRVKEIVNIIQGKIQLIEKYEVVNE